MRASLWFTKVTSTTAFDSVLKRSLSATLLGLDNVYLTGLWPSASDRANDSSNVIDILFVETLAETLQYLSQHFNGI